LWERKRKSLNRKRSFLHKGDIIIIILKSHAGNDDKRGGSMESLHDKVVEIYDQLSKNNFEILVGIVIVKLKEEYYFKSKLGEKIFNENHNHNG
jgi:hypothetical protein